VINAQGQGQQMESLERKLERLSPQQRRQVEDFADFLLQRQKESPSPPLNRAGTPSPPAAVPPPLTVQEVSPAPEPVKAYDLIQGQGRDSGEVEEDPVILLMKEIAVDDSLADDYMDYGKYEPPPPSPATDAVQRVKEKLNRKKENDPAKKMLEWID
jgi:hypothetical protein